MAEHVGGAIIGPTDASSSPDPAADCGTGSPIRSTADSGTRAGKGAALTVARVTVITRTRNRPLLLERAIRSVLGQTFGGWEHLIVNDGGDAAELDERLKAHETAYAGRLRVLHRSECGGMQVASNTALEAAQGEFVVIHDDDDTWSPRFLEEAVGWLDAAGPEAGEQGVACQVVRVFETLHPDGSLQETGREDYQPFDSVSLYGAAAENPFPPIAFLYRRAVHERLGRFDPTLDVLGDWDFLLRFLRDFEIGVLPRKLAFYHWRPEVRDSRYGNTVVEGLGHHRRMLERMRNRYLRADLASGSASLGEALNSARSLRDLEKEVTALREDLANLRERVGQPLSAGTAHEVPPSEAHLPETNADREDAPPTDSRRFRKMLSSVRVLSLDIFDTCIRRTVLEPEDVFALFEPRIRQLLERPGLAVPRLRIEAERLAREEVREVHPEFEDVQLAEIWALFCRRAGIPETMAKELVSIEIACEERLIHADRAALRLAHEGRKQGRKVVYLSDMYLPEGLLRQWLDRLGFPEGEVFSSGDRRRTKHSGRLYRLVEEQTGYEPTDFLHVGDNRHGDVYRAEAAGWKVFAWEGPGRPPAFFEKARIPLRRPPEDTLSSLTAGLARKSRWAVDRTAGHRSGGAAEAWSKKPIPALWHRLGYEIAGPLYLAWLQWIVRQAQQDGVDRLFFLSRDGYYPRRAYEKLQAAWGWKPEGRYLHASRRLYNFARLARFSEARLKFIMTPNPRLRVRDFFTRMDMDAGRFAGLLASHGFHDLDEVVTTADGIFADPDYYHRFHAIFWTLSEEIAQRAGAERDQLMEYLGGNGMPSAHTAIVDVGWQASSIAALYDLDDSIPASGLRGYYFATWRFASAAIEEGCPVSSFFIHLDQPEERARLIEESVALIELLFTAPEPTVVGLRKGEEGQWEPLHGEPEMDAGGLARIEALWQGAEAFLDAAIAAAPDAPPGEGHAYLEAALDRLLRHPLPEEAAEIGSLRHRQAFGNTRNFSIAPAPPHWLESFIEPERILDEYRHAGWRRGYLARLGERSRHRLEQQLQKGDEA